MAALHSIATIRLAKHRVTANDPVATIVLSVSEDGLPMTIRWHVCVKRMSEKAIEEKEDQYALDTRIHTVC